MSRLSKNILRATFLALCLLGPQTPLLGQENRAIAIAKLARESTVAIETDKGSGSGFVISQEFIATNHHVIKDASKIFVHLVGTTEKMKATLFANDEDNDLAVLRVRGLDAPPLALSLERLPSQGSKVYVYGNPLDLEGTFSSGEVSALRGNRFIQITAPISPGSSGGPVFDGRGFVIGVAKAQILDPERRSQNLNLAIPIFYLSELLNGRVALKHSIPPSSDSESDDENDIEGNNLSAKLVGIWDGENTESGFVTKVVWQVNADGTNQMWFTSPLGTFYRTGRWRYSKGVLDQGAASGTISWINDNHILITIIQNEDGPSSKGRTRHYYRRTQ